MEKTIIIQADSADAGMRYDQFLAKKLTVSRSLAARLMKEGRVSAATSSGSSSSFKAAQLIVGHETFAVEQENKIPAIMMPEAMSLDIVYNDEHIAVINKPAGLVVHPGAGVKDGTLCNALLHHFPDLSHNAGRPGIVHRLDKYTSGLMVVAKTSRAHEILSDDFKNRHVKKAYRVYCFGEIKKSSFELKTGHMRHPHHRLRFLTTMPEPKLSRPGGCRSAHTSFVVLNAAFGITELVAILHTGRTHQIRAHLADIGHTLLGDDLYGADGRHLHKSCPEQLAHAVSQLRGQALHAEVLKFFHPITKNFLEFTSTLPEPLLSISRYFS